MTTTTQGLWGRLVEGARIAWREQKRIPNPIAEHYRPREKTGRSIISAMIQLTFMTVVLASIAYVTADIFLRFGSPVAWLIYQIAWFYGRLCQQGGYCSVPFLNAGLVVGIDMVTLITVYLWSSLDSLGQPDDFADVHDHLDLVSEQIRTDYNRLERLEERLNAVEASIEEADNRVDVVVEYQPQSKGEAPAETLEARTEQWLAQWGDPGLTSEAAHDPDPSAPAA